MTGERPHEVECVYIPETDRGTLCLSSQVGCTLTCSFCHTGTQRLVRNLTPGEIVGQVMVARDRLDDWQRKSGLPDLRSKNPKSGMADLRTKNPNSGKPEFGSAGDRPRPADRGDRFVSNIVMMGMGEPLYNFEAVRDAIARDRGRRGPEHLQAPHHALDLGRGADDRARGRRDRLDAGGIAARRARRTAQRAGAAQSQISDPRNCSTPAATIRASPMRGASRSNT